MGPVVFIVDFFTFGPFSFIFKRIHVVKSIIAY